MRGAPSWPPRFSVGTVRISCVDMAGAVDAFFGCLRDGRGGYVACTCAHGIVEAERDPQLRGILNGSLLTLPDGMPTVWVGRAKGYPVSRVTAPDFLEAVLRDPRARSLRHYFLGGSARTLSAILAKAAGLVGETAIAGAWSPPIRPAGVIEAEDAIDAMAATRPDAIWVGLGLPKQEYWMAQHTVHFPRAIMVGIGAAFDWFAGTQPRAPRWVQGLGLEWAHRVMSEPARLWPRYREIVPRALRIVGRELAAARLSRIRLSRA